MDLVAEKQDSPKTSLPPPPSSQDIAIFLLVFAISLVLGWQGGPPLVVRLFFICFSLAGAVSSIRSTTEGLGRQWLKGFETLSDLFMAIGGMLAGLPLLKRWFGSFFGWFRYIGSSPAVAANMFIAVDMGGNSLAQDLAHADVSKQYAATIVGYSLGVTVSYSLPLALVMWNKSQRILLILGLLPGLLAVPLGVFITNALLAVQKPLVNTEIRVGAPLDATLDVKLWEDTIAVLVPCWALGIAGCLCAKFKMQLLITVFAWLGCALDVLIRSFFWLSLVQYAGGQLSLFERYAPFLVMDPLVPGVKPSEGETTGLEIAGSIVLILTGVYPFIMLVQEKLLLPLCKLGKLMGFRDPQGHGILAVLGCTTNSICLLQIVSENPVRPEETIMSVAFMVSGSFTLGDYLVYASLYQPGILLPLMLGKLVGGVFAVFVARLTTCRFFLHRVAEWPEFSEESEDAEH